MLARDDKLGSRDEDPTVCLFPHKGRDKVASIMLRE